VSPLAIRRYRAERLLREEFEAMRGRVLGVVRARLRAAGVALDASDLEACYAQAWHGLYTAMLEGGTEIASPEGWLTLVTYRRALDEHRAHGARVTPVGDPDQDVSAGSLPGSGAAGEMSSKVATCARASRARASAPFGNTHDHDLADSLDDRIRLRRLLEGLRARLSQREREAAALCYLQGLSRAQAAARMGISESRMRKLMDGSRTTGPGVASKVGRLLEAISADAYCAEQDSLMRGFAFGVLAPDGERYALALAHQHECPACRLHVLTLRGLAAVLPLPPLPWMLGAGVLAGAGAGVGTGGGVGVGATAGAGSAGGAAASGTGTAAPTGAGLAGAGGGAAAASGAAGAGAAGGGWLVAGGLAGKLAVGCLVAVGVGAGCVALTIVPVAAPHAPAQRRPRFHAGVAQAPIVEQALRSSPGASSLSSNGPSGARIGSRRTGVGAGTASLAHAAKASREFGLEQPVRARGPATPARGSATATAASDSVASADGPSASGTGAGANAAGSQGSGDGGGSVSQPRDSGGPDAAAHEFGLG
jgi:RNA polymerase sigma factor (sigma-70 family)